MTHVISRHDRDKQQTMDDYKKRLIEKMDEIDVDISNLEIQLHKEIADRAKMISSIFRWFASYKRKIHDCEERIDELEEKRAVKLRLLGSIKQKLRVLH